MFTCIGNTIGKCAIASADCLTNQQINSIVANANTDPKFIYYLLCNNVTSIKRLGGGAATPIINKTTFQNIEVLVPPLDVQRRIGALLSGYDDLLQNNRRRMELLEEAARLLYQEWFVRLRFPGHEHTCIIDGVPEGWKRKSLGDVLTLNYGKALREEAREAGCVPVYGSSGVIGYHDTKLVTAPSIVVGRKGNVGSVYWVDRDYWPIDTVYFIESYQSTYFILHNLKHQPFQNSDAAVPGLNRAFAYSLPIIWPTTTLRDQFEEFAKVVYKQLSTLEALNEKLRAARDLLLPRLMSGELAV